MKRWALILIVCLPFRASAQEDTLWVPYAAGMDLNDGLYRNFQEFRMNAPGVPLARLRDAQGHAVHDIRTLVSKLYWQPDTGALQVIRAGNVWGFCQNDVIYIAAGSGFYRIGLMGSLGHMVYEVTYRDWDPYMDPYGGVTRTALAHLLLDMNTGAFLDFNAGGMAEALKADPVLLDEFLAVPKKERNKDATLFRFLRFYNERHPLLFPQ
jgi:hypothetical protein